MPRHPGRSRLWRTGLITVALVVCLSLTAATALGEGVTWRVQGAGQGVITDISCSSSSSCETTGIGGIPAYIDGRLWPHGVSRPNRRMGTLSCAGDRCLAVGLAKGFLPVIQRSTGLNWGRAKTLAPHSPGAKSFADLSGVYCASASDCFAVGSEGGAYVSCGALSSRQRLADADAAGLLAGARDPLSALWGGRAVRALSLRASGLCEVAHPLVEHLVGGRWRARARLPLPPSPKRMLGAALNDVSCSSAHSCEAVGAMERRRFRDGLFAERWNGQRWSLQRIAIGFPHAHGRFGRLLQIRALSCASAQRCIAVGFRGLMHPRSVVIRYDGGRWKLVHPPLPAHQKLTVFVGASCAPGGPCMLVGASQRAHHRLRPLVERWSGFRWTRERVPLPRADHGHGAVVRAVSCPSADACELAGGVLREHDIQRWFVDRYSVHP